MLYSLVRPLLFSLDPEAAHEVSLRLAAFSPPRRVPPRPVRVMGIDFPNPVGLAAGLDKHAEHVHTVAAMGFGFIELGGVTPRPQPGNPRPRLFRLPEARAIINRYGLNSIGIDAFTANLKRARERGSPAVSEAIIGVNIAKNRDTPNERALDDYERCLDALYPYVHYVTLNVSSPNTKGLRDLQSAQFLTQLLRGLQKQREALRERHGRNVAFVLKISPDLDEAAITAIAEVALRERVEGLLACNTTVSREGVAGLSHGGEEGGLSGAPLMARSTQVLRAFARLLKNEVALIGGGGILSGADAGAKFEAGASLVQVYSGLVFRGPGLITECVEAWSAKKAG